MFCFDSNLSDVQFQHHNGDTKERFETDAWPSLDTVDLRHNVLSELDEMVFRGALSNVRLAWLFIQGSKCGQVELDYDTIYLSECVILKS